MTEGSADERPSGAAKMGARSREALRRVRYTLTSIGVEIPSSSSDPALLMKTLTLPEWAEVL
jgi:hypothetical protein